MNAQDIEIAVAAYYNSRVNIIVPNVSWGMGFGHECDVLVMTPAGILTEIEIKISKSDLKKDFTKGHNHSSKYIKSLYFAYPEKMKDCDALIPAGVGIYHAQELDCGTFKHISLKMIRPATAKKVLKLSDGMKYKLMRLGCMRIWTLKQKLKEYRCNLNELNNKANKIVLQIEN